MEAVHLYVDCSFYYYNNRIAPNSLSPDESIRHRRHRQTVRFNIAKYFHFIRFDSCIL